MSVSFTAQKVDELEHTIRELAGVAAELDRQIKIEEARTRISDLTDPGYSSFANSARKRHDNLLASINRLQMELCRERDRVERLKHSDTQATYPLSKNVL
jgi:flagellar protein FliJ